MQGAARGSCGSASAGPMTAPPPGLPSPAIREDGKVVVRFQHTGGAPILKQQKYKLAADARFSTVITLLKKQLGLKANDSLVRTTSHALRITVIFARMLITRLLSVDATARGSHCTVFVLQQCICAAARRARC